MRVFISGYGMYSSLGNNPESAMNSLIENRSAVKLMDEWAQMKGLNCWLGAPVQPYDKSVIPRLARRTMSPMSEMSTLATMQALESANLKVSDIDPQRAMLSIGSTTGSPQVLQEYFERMSSNETINQSGTSFFKIMNHSVASNTSVALGFSGAVLAPSSACATSAQAAIMGWEAIQSGLYDIVICGGADELHFLSAVVFDSVYAASRNYNDRPDYTPRPFDQKRDGLVVSEGASIIILESERSLQKRGGKALGEFLAGAYLCESSHMSQSNCQQMIRVMNMALDRAQVKATDIEYVSAHATGTVQGDAQEAAAIGEVFGNKTPVSSLKGHFGHSLAACGVGEVIMTLKMMEKGILIGNRNLDEVAEDCQGVNLLKKNTKLSTNLALSNNFAFGGINTSLIIRSCQ